MSDLAVQSGFTETHHALLFGWIAKAIIVLVGVDEGESVLRIAIQKYGHERGWRMALRAKANRQPLTMWNFPAYRSIDFDHLPPKGIS